MKRRCLLLGGGPVSAIGLSGCLGALGENRAELIGLVVVNHFQEQETLQVRVEQNDEIVHDSTHELDPNTSESIDCTWTTDGSTPAISAQFSGADEWSAIELDDYDSDCAYVYVNVNPRGGVIDFALSDNCEHEGAC